MITSNELLFTVNQYNQPITPLPRHEVHKRKIWHRTTEIWIVNSDNQILCQKRFFLKDTDPGKWEALFGGHILAKEESKVNAINEVQEEIGLALKINDLHFIHIIQNKRLKHYQYIYYIIWNGDRNQLHLEQAEVSEIKWHSFITLREILTEKDLSWVIYGYELNLLQYLAEQ